MDFDWDNATVKVSVPVYFTAGHEVQEVTLPLSSFARLLLTSVPAEWFAQPPISDDLPLHIDPGPIPVADPALQATGEPHARLGSQEGSE